MFEWVSRARLCEVTWVVLCAEGTRGEEARASAQSMLSNVSKKSIVMGNLRDGHFPAQYSEAKALFEELKGIRKPDVILTHHLQDRHQDHRLVSELTWQTFRDHLILEYEIPKYEGSVGEVNAFVPLSAGSCGAKIAHLERHFGSQGSKAWFRDETFRGLMSLRGIECRAKAGFAEAFLVRKCVLGG